MNVSFGKIYFLVVSLFLYVTIDADFSSPNANAPLISIVTIYNLSGQSSGMNVPPPYLHWQPNVSSAIAAAVADVVANPVVSGSGSLIAGTVKFNCDDILITGDVVVQGAVEIDLPAGGALCINGSEYAGTIPGLTVTHKQTSRHFAISGSIASSLLFLQSRNQRVVIAGDVGVVAMVDSLPTDKVYVKLNFSDASLTVSGALLFNGGSDQDYHIGSIYNAGTITVAGNITMNYNQGFNGLAGIENRGTIQTTAGNIEMVYNYGGTGGGAGVGGSGESAAVGGSIIAAGSITMNNNVGGQSSHNTGGGAGVGGGGGGQTNGGAGSRIVATSGSIESNTGGYGAGQGGSGAGFGGGGGGAGGSSNGSGGDGSAYSSGIIAQASEAGGDGTDSMPYGTGGTAYNAV